MSTSTRYAETAAAIHQLRAQQQRPTLAPADSRMGQSGKPPAVLTYERGSRAGVPSTLTPAGQQAQRDCYRDRLDWRRRY